MASTEVEFYVLLDNKLRSVTILPNKTLSELFETILKANSKKLGHLKKYNSNDFSFKALKNPVRVNTSEEGAKSTIQACLDKNNWNGVIDEARVKTLSPKFDENFVYLAVILIDKQEEAVGNLKNEHLVLFNLLRAKVINRYRWSEQDVRGNGGRKVDYEHAPAAIKEITERLTQKRTYARLGHEECKEFMRAQAYEEDFPKMFSPAGRAIVTASPREYFMFHRILIEYTENAVSVADRTSSSIKADTFRGSFIYPVFSPAPPDSHIFYDQEMGWRFPIFLSFLSTDMGLRKYSPKSDFHVISKPFDFPLLIGEVISQRNEEDRWRMLIQAIAAVRTGQYLTKPGGRKFTLVAVYLTGALEVERYILTQGTGTHTWRPEHENTNIEQPIVDYTIKSFDLKIKDQAIQFLLEMTNLVEILNDFAGDFDPEKAEELAEIQGQAKNVRSLHSKASGGSTGPSLKAPSLHPISENSNGEQDSVLDSEEVETLLDRLGYSITLHIDRNPNVAKFMGGHNATFYGYVKFVKKGNRETDILQYLSGLDSPMNHTIKPIEIWPIEQGSLVLMPRAGVHLTDLEMPSSHLWSTSRQLFEAIQFMHDNGIAHMDLKPQNIVIPAEYGKLTIIDFSLAVRLERGDSFKGYVGTKPYIAPEVKNSTYSAVRADLWSCGAVVKELCMLCEPSTAQARLLEISSLLMDNDPMKRPMMKEVLEMISSPHIEPPDVQGLSASPILPRCAVKRPLVLDGIRSPPMVATH